MKTLITTLALVSLAAFTSTASEENINESRDAKAGGQLVVDVDFGSIDVAAGAADKVVIEAHRKVRASSEEKEKEFLAAAPITITAENGNVTVRARREKKAGILTSLWHGNIKTKGSYTLHVPANYNVNLNTAGGEISANGLTGTIKADTSGGDLKFTNLHGPINAETSGGRVDVESCEGAIDVETSGGSIRAMGGKGSLRAHTSGGMVAVGNFAGDANVETSGGRLKLENIGGKITGETSGGSITAVLASPVPGDVKLETSAGAIEVAAATNVALTVDAETSAGEVMTTLPFTTTHSGHESLKGTINGGGKLLRLRTSAGSILITSTGNETAKQ